jgi:hypothetical protein
MSAMLPEQLRYLEAALRQLANTPAEKLSEDVDVSTLEGALRCRVRGLSIREAQERLQEDRELLANWLDSSENEAASGQWLLAFLGYRPGALARRLLAPPVAQERLPEITFELPDGWSFERVPLSLQLRRGRKTMGTIISIDASSLAHMLYHNEVRDKLQSQNRNPLGVVGSWAKSPVQYREVRGHKFLYNQIAPVPWKSVQYLLDVPGGSVNIMLDGGGRDFDETEFEAQLHTLRVAGPG